MNARQCIAAALAAAAPALAAGEPAVPASFLRPDEGDCIACHRLPEALGAPSRADFGPPLEGARMRELGRERLAQLLHDPMRANPGTAMPPFGRHRILAPAEIERLVEFLLALP